MNNKNKNFNTLISKGNKGKTMEERNTCDVHGKPIRSDEKPWRVKDKISFTLKSSLLLGKLGCYI